MCRITIKLTKTNETRLRELNRKKGDLSNIINKALDEYFANIDRAQAEAEYAEQESGYNNSRGL